MAQKQVFLGSVGPLLYDDATFFALDTEGKVRVQTAPTAANEVARLQEMTDHGAEVDPHTIYLKEKASGGVASEIPVHNHSAAGEAGQITTAALSDYTEATFTITGTGFTVNPTGTARYVKIGNLVALFIPVLTGTSNATTFTLTGIPAAIRATRQTRHVPVRIQNGSANQSTSGYINIVTGSIWDVRRQWNEPGWTASGTKTLNACTAIYTLL